MCESIGKNRQLSFCCFVCFKSVYNLVLFVLFFSLLETASGFRRLYIDNFLSHFHKTNSFFSLYVFFFVFVLFFLISFSLEYEYLFSKSLRWTNQSGYSNWIEWIFSFLVACMVNFCSDFRANVNYVWLPLLTTMIYARAHDDQMMNSYHYRDNYWISMLNDGLI